MNERPATPTEVDALEVARRHCGRTPRSVRRFTTGIGHWVYEVHPPEGAPFVVRLAKAEQLDDFLGAAHWSSVLRPLGVPLPALLEKGIAGTFPYLVLERLPGTDLGAVYATLTTASRRSVATRVCEIQRAVGALPHQGGFGFARLPTGPFLSSWRAVVEASLSRSRSRMAAVGSAGRTHVNQVEACVSRFDAYFASILPIPFLDDATTKNVLVHEGKLSGIVDVDWLCFGDPLLTIALTRTSLLNAGADTEYTDYWCDLLELSALQRSAVRFYTALFCVDFMSEVGQHFNGAVVSGDDSMLDRLTQLLSRELAGL